MRRKQYDALVAQVRALPAEAVLAAACRCDGHTIFKPEAFHDAGLPPAVVAHVTRTHRSDGTPKGSIFADGRVVPELSGVYGLDLLRFLADALGVAYADALGRGTQARRIQAALKLHFERQRQPQQAPRAG